MKRHMLISTAAALAVMAGGMVWFHHRDVADRGGDPHVAPAPSPLRPVPSAPKSPPELEIATSAAHHWEERVNALRALPAKLDQASVDRLFDYLGEPPASGLENWYVVANEILEVLRKRRMAPATYSSRLVAIIRSPKADPMIRDYACQHLAQWISGMSPGSTEPDPAVASDAFAAMCAEVTKPENAGLTLVGTALNALADAVLNGNAAMSDRGPELGELALAVLSNPDGTLSTVNRSTALQVAARLEVEGLPQICRTLAGDASVSADIRLSAIAALGQVGSAADATFIRQFASDDALKFAANAALERLQRRGHAE